MSALNEISTPQELSAWMKRMNLSVTAAAQHLGRKRATISRYIKGETDLPESVCRHAAILEAALRGKPFETRSVTRQSEILNQPIGVACKMPGNLQVARQSAFRQ